jgi:hypothetical protein
MQDFPLIIPRLLTHAEKFNRELRAQFSEYSLPGA